MGRLRGGVHQTRLSHLAWRPAALAAALTMGLGAPLGAQERPRPRADDTTPPPGEKEAAVGQPDAPPARPPARRKDRDKDKEKPRRVRKGPPEPPKDPAIEPLDEEGARKAFDKALDVFYRQDYVEAAARYWLFLRAAPPTTENYGWGYYFLAESLRHLGLWHAAVQYYYVVAKTRTQPEVLADTLSRLEAISSHRPVDEDLVYEDLIYDSEFGFLPQQAADWVSYIQGLYNYQRGFIDWGNRHFQAISKDSTYGLESLYVKAVYAVRESRDEEAVDHFRGIIDSPIAAPEIKNKAKLALARLQFERGRYQDARDMYEEVQQEELSYEHAQLLVEKAWSAFNLKQYSKALGMLHSLQAPSFEPFFFPDAYLLRGLILKDLCHYLAAKHVVRSFRFKYGRALEQVKQRVPLERIQRIRRAAMRQGSIARRTKFLENLAEERTLISEYGGAWDNHGLDRHLRRLYDLSIREQERVWALEFTREADRVALELLETAEQIDLLDYEIGLEIYRPLKVDAENAPDVVLSIPFERGNIYYEFDTEYWNDELHDYRFFITSRCMGQSE